MSLAIFTLALALSLTASCLAANENEAKMLVMERSPFDRIVLNAANKNAQIDVTLLNLPQRRLPNPLPSSGAIEVRRLSQPSIPYQVQWNSIQQVLLFEQMVLNEAVQLTRQGENLDAFRSLQFLHKHYPKMSGLNQVSENFLKREAGTVFQAGKHEDSLAILLTLYDLNPNYRDLDKAVSSVSDQVISALLKERDYAAARGVLEMLKQSFPKLGLTNVSGWESRFRQGATRQVSIAEKAVATNDFDSARLALRRAIDILPTVPGANELIMEIDRRAPRTVVAVHQSVSAAPNKRELTWAEARVSQLVAPQLVEMVSFGTEGGIYRSRWAELQSDDTGTEFGIEFSPLALSQGFSPEQFALSLLANANPTSDRFQTAFADAFDYVTITSGQQTTIHWRRPHIRPEALLSTPITDVVAGGVAPGVYRGSADPEFPSNMRYDLSTISNAGGQPRQVIERAFDSADQAIVSLQTGQIDAIDLLAPWEADQLKNYPNISVESYRLPTVHALRLNYENPLLKSREFRRAICYGIDRERIVDDVLKAGSNRLGFRVLSGPLPAGTSYTDPVAYAYNQQLQPRPYEPRLASVLATVARSALAKREKAKNSKTAEQPQPETDAQEAEQDDKGKEKEKPKPPKPLKLAHPPSDLARTCCQTIKLQLTAIGIPIELIELPTDASDLPAQVDLIYTELAIREPLVDARQLLGPNGLAGICSSSMTMALENVDKAKNWSEATERLREVHRISYYDLPLIPLWQTIDRFAYRNSLRGIVDQPVSLYQDVTQWQSFQSGGGQ